MFSHRLSLQINYVLIATIIVIIICFFGLIFPLYPFIHLDSDSVNYLKSDVVEAAVRGYSSWGVYRVGAIVFKSLVYAIPGVTEGWFAIQIIASVMAKVVFSIAASRALSLDKCFLPLIIAAAIGQIFWLDISLVLSRSLNDLLSAFLAAIFLYITSKKNYEGRRLASLVFFYGLLSLVMYESYSLYAVIIVLAVRLNQALWIIIGGFSATILTLALHFEGTFLRSPKFIQSANSAMNGLKGFNLYFESKLDQVIVSVSHVVLNDILIALFFGVLMLIVLSFAYKDLSQAKSKNEKNIQLRFSRWILIIFGMMPLLLLFATAKIGPNGSRMQWLIIGNSIWMLVLGLVVGSQMNRFSRQFLSILVACFFGFSVLLTNQLAYALKACDMPYLQNSIYRNLSMALVPSYCN